MLYKAQEGTTCQQKNITLKIPMSSFFIATVLNSVYRGALGAYGYLARLVVGLVL